MQLNSEMDSGDEPRGPTRRRKEARIALFGVIAAGLVLSIGWLGAGTQGNRVDEAWQYAIRDSVDLGQPGLVAVTMTGPQPEFDTSAHGTEIPIRKYSDGDDTSAIASGFPYSWPGLAVAYVGSVGEPDTRAFIALRDEGSPSMYLSGVVRFGDITANELGFTQDAPESAFQTVSGEILNRGPHDLLIVAFLPPETSIVAVSLADGSRYWQRPVGGMVFLVMDDLGRNESIDVVVLDKRGKVIGNGTELTHYQSLLFRLEPAY